MGAYLNREVDHAGADTTIVPVNRWGVDDYSIQITAGTWTFRSTLDRVNRGETPNWSDFSVVDSTGATVPATGLAPGFYKVDFFPIEALEAVSAGAGRCRIMQQGATDWA